MYIPLIVFVLISSSLIVSLRSADKQLPAGHDQYIPPGDVIILQFSVFIHFVSHLPPRSEWIAPSQAQNQNTANLIRYVICLKVM